MEHISHTVRNLVNAMRASTYKQEATSRSIFSYSSQAPFFAGRHEQERRGQVPVAAAAQVPADAHPPGGHTQEQAVLSPPPVFLPPSLLLPPVLVPGPLAVESLQNTTSLCSFPVPRTFRSFSGRIHSPCTAFAHGPGRSTVYLAPVFVWSRGVRTPPLRGARLRPSPVRRQVELAVGRRSLVRGQNFGDSSRRRAAGAQRQEDPL